MSRWNLQPAVAQAVLAVAVLAAILASASAQRSRTRYLTTEEVDIVLNNERLLAPYVRCLLDTLPCRNQDAKDLRRSVPEALATGCASCSANEKQLTERVIRQLRVKWPKVWAALIAKYDPKGEYERRYGAATASTASTAPSATSPGLGQTPNSAPRPTASTNSAARTAAATTGPARTPTPA